MKKLVVYTGGGYPACEEDVPRLVRSAESAGLEVKIIRVDELSDLRA